MRTSTPRLVLLLILLISFIAGCGGTVCSQLGDARATLNISLDAVHTAHVVGMLSARDEKVLQPYLVGIDAALTQGEQDCIAEQNALKAGDKPAAQSALARAAKYLKAANAGIRAYAAAEPPQVAAVKKSTAATQPTR